MQKILSTDELPIDVSMKLTHNDLWREVSIDYPKNTIKIDILRTDNDVIRRLAFSKIDKND